MFRHADHHIFCIRRGSGSIPSPARRRARLRPQGRVWPGRFACMHPCRLQGEMWIHPVAAARLAERMTSPNLTSREIEILQLLALGKSNKEIGSSLDVTKGTIKVHVNHILATLGVTGRVEAIRVAVQRGLVHLLAGTRESTRGLTSQQERSTGPGRSGGDISKAIAASKSTSQLPR